MNAIKNLIYFFFRKKQEDDDNDKEIEFKEESSGPEDDFNRINQIQKQMEYYLSNSSLQTNIKLRNLVMKNQERYVPISIFTKLPKMVAMSTSQAEIVSAIQKSPLLELDGSCNMVRSIHPFVYDSHKIDKTICISGLNNSITYDQLKFSLLTYNPTFQINQITLRHKRSQNSDDSNVTALIEFSTEAQAIQALNFDHFPEAIVESAIEYQNSHKTNLYHYNVVKQHHFNRKNHK